MVSIHFIAFLAALNCFYLIKEQTRQQSYCKIVCSPNKIIIDLWIGKTTDLLYQFRIFPIIFFWTIIHNSKPVTKKKPNFFYNMFVLFIFQSNYLVKICNGTEVQIFQIITQFRLENNKIELNHLIELVLCIYQYQKIVVFITAPV